KTFQIATGGGCGDCHAIWMDPKNPNHWIATGDAGAGITRNHGRAFQQVALPIAQMYHVAIDDQAPYWVYGNRQDNGTMRGPSTAPEGAQATRGIAVGFGRGGRGGGRGNDSTLGRGAGRAAQTRISGAARPDTMTTVAGRGARPDSA